MNHALLSTCHVFSRAPIQEMRPAVRPPTSARSADEAEPER